MASTNNGTSVPQNISGTQLTINRGSQLIQTHLAANGLNAPRPNKDGSPSQAFNLSDASALFTFQKICPPDYGTSDSIARYTGIPINKPDFIADFHFIGLMRAADKFLLPKNKALIGGSGNTPKSTS